MWTRTSTCRQNGYGFTAPYPYEVTAGGAAAGELLGGVTGSRQILVVSDTTRVGKGLKPPPRRGELEKRSSRSRDRPSLRAPSEVMLSS